MAAGFGGRMMNMQAGKDTVRIASIQKRQTARLLDHLERTGKLTPELRSDILRSFGYVFQDINDALKQGDGKNEHGNA
jgi:hypothetical protein